MPCMITAETCHMVQVKTQPQAQHGTTRHNMAWHGTGQHSTAEDMQLRQSMETQLCTIIENSMSDAANYVPSSFAATSAWACEHCSALYRSSSSKPAQDTFINSTTGSCGMCTVAMQSRTGNWAEQCCMCCPGDYLWDNLSGLKTSSCTLSHTSRQQSPGFPDDSQTNLCSLGTYITGFRV